MGKKCDFCDSPAQYDGLSASGRWANMCEKHFKVYGVGLGTGRGQKLVKKISIGKPEKILSVSMSEKDMEECAYEGMWHPKCPYCKTKTGAEVDADEVYCGSCDQKFLIDSQF